MQKQILLTKRTDSESAGTGFLLSPGRASITSRAMADQSARATDISVQGTSKTGAYSSKSVKVSQALRYARASFKVKQDAAAGQPTSRSQLKTFHNYQMIIRDAITPNTQPKKKHNANSTISPQNFGDSAISPLSLLLSTSSNKKQFQNSKEGPFFRPQVQSAYSAHLKLSDQKGQQIFLQGQHQQHYIIARSDDRPGSASERLGSNSNIKSHNLSQIRNHIDTAYSRRKGSLHRRVNVSVPQRIQQLEQDITGANSCYPLDFKSLFDSKLQKCLNIEKLVQLQPLKILGKSTHYLEKSQMMLDEVVQQNTDNNSEKEQDKYFLADFLSTLDQKFGGELVNVEYIPTQRFMRQLCDEFNKIFIFVQEKLIGKHLHFHALFCDRLWRILITTLDRLFAHQKQVVDEKLEEEKELINQQSEILQQRCREYEAQIDSLRNELVEQANVHKQKFHEVEEYKNDLLIKNDQLRQRLKELTSAVSVDDCVRDLDLQALQLGKAINLMQQELDTREIESNILLKEIARSTMDNQRKFNRAIKNQSGRSLINSENSEVGGGAQELRFAAQFMQARTLGQIFFSHPFEFYVLQDFHKYSYAEQLEKFSRENVVRLLENFMDDLYFDRSTVIGDQESLNMPRLLLNRILKNNGNVYYTSIRVNEVLLCLQLNYNQQRDYAHFYALLLGLFQEEILAPQHATRIIELRFKLKDSSMSDKQEKSLLQDEIYVEAQTALLLTRQVLFGTSSAQLKEINPVQRELEERINVFFEVHKKTVEARWMEQNQHLKSAKQQSAMTIVPLLMEKLNTSDVNRVVDHLRELLERADIDAQKSVSYEDFLHIMKREFQIDQHYIQESEYFREFISNDQAEFEYGSFLERLRELHIEDRFNTHKVTLFNYLNFIASQLIAMRERDLKQHVQALCSNTANNIPTQIFSFKAHQEWDQDTRSQFSSVFYQGALAENKFELLYTQLKQVRHPPLEDLARVAYVERQLTSNLTIMLRTLNGFDNLFQELSSLDTEKMRKIALQKYTGQEMLRINNTLFGVSQNQSGQHTPLTLANDGLRHSGEPSQRKSQASLLNASQFNFAPNQFFQDNTTEEKNKKGKTSGQKPAQGKRKQAKNLLKVSD